MDNNEVTLRKLMRFGTPSGNAIRADTSTMAIFRLARKNWSKEKGCALCQDKQTT